DDGRLAASAPTPLQGTSPTNPIEHPCRKEPSAIPKPGCSRAEVMQCLMLTQKAARLSPLFSKTTSGSDPASILWQFVSLVKSILARYDAKRAVSPGFFVWIKFFISDKRQLCVKNAIVLTYAIEKSSSTTIIV
ncbi:MAG: hypothetical protein ACOVOI_12500, partial [Hyphomicrobiales bacterium]